MAINPSFNPIKTPDGLMVSVPANMSSTGKRQRRFFQDPKDAEKFAAGLRAKYRSGQRGGMIPFNLSMEAVEAERILSDYGIGVLDGAKQIASMMAILEPHGATLIEAVKDYAARLAADDQPESFRERWLRAMIEGEERWSKIYARDMSKIERFIGMEMMDRRCSTITPGMITSALREHGAKAQSTIQHRTRYVNAILHFKPRHRKDSTVHIMTPSQCAQMLRACESPAERRVVAVLLFAGIRPMAEDGEISRLDWQHFKKDGIHLPGTITKTGTDRIIPIMPRLARLLRGHPRSGSVVPPNWPRIYKRLRKAVDGIHGQQDVTRHTFASNFLAAYGEKSTKEAMGHTQGSQTLFRHYRAAITEAAGLKFFS